MGLLLLLLLLSTACAVAPGLDTTLNPTPSDTGRAVDVFLGGRVRVSSSVNATHMDIAMRGSSVNGWMAFGVVT